MNSDSLLDKSREATRRHAETARQVAQPRAVSMGGDVGEVFKAIADPVNGTISIKAVNADGSVEGDAITLAVLP